MVSPTDPPSLDLKEDDLVDWLELNALFDPYGVGRVDALMGSLLGLEETAEDDIAKRDSERESRIEKIENEVRLRQSCLEDAYPFELSETGEEL